MKGLLLSNLKRTGLSWRQYLLFMPFIGMIGFLIKTQNILMIVIYLLLSSGPLLYLSLCSRDNELNWTKLELVFPVKREQIVLSKYLTFIIFFLLSIPFVGAYLAGNLISGNLLWETHLLSLILLGSGIIVSIAVFFYPLLYLLGSGKSEVVLLISLFFSIIPIRIFMEIAKYFLNLENVFLLHNYLIFHSTYFLLVSICYLCSYFICVRIFKNKDF